MTGFGYIPPGLIRAMPRRRKAQQQPGLFGCSRQGHRHAEGQEKMDENAAAVHESRLTHTDTRVFYGPRFLDVPAMARHMAHTRTASADHLDVLLGCVAPHDKWSFLLANGLVAVERPPVYRRVFCMRPFAYTLANTPGYNPLKMLFKHVDGMTAATGSRASLGTYTTVQWCNKAARASRATLESGDAIATTTHTARLTVTTHYTLHGFCTVTPVSIQAVEDTKMDQAQAEVTKGDELGAYLREGNMDIDELRRLALSHGGLYSSDLRQQLWPVLCGLSPVVPSPSSPSPTTPLPPSSLLDRTCTALQDRISHLAELYTIEVDVPRTFYGFLHTDSLALVNARQLLFKVLTTLMAKHSLSYTQGFHSVVSILILTLCPSLTHTRTHTHTAIHAITTRGTTASAVSAEEEDLCFAVAERVMLNGFRHFLHPNFDVVKSLLRLIHPLVSQFDGALGELLDECFDRAPGLFAVSEITTWFSHDMTDLNTAARVFDACMSSHAMFPSYLAAAVVLHRRDDILRAGSDDASGAFQVAAELPADLPWDTLINMANAMMATLPPERLVNENPQDAAAELMRQGTIMAFLRVCKRMTSRTSAANTIMRPITTLHGSTRRCADPHAHTREHTPATRATTPTTTSSTTPAAASTTGRSASAWRLPISPATTSRGPSPSSSRALPTCRRPLRLLARIT